MGKSEGVPWLQLRIDELVILSIWLMLPLYG